MHEQGQPRTLFAMVPQLLERPTQGRDITINDLPCHLFINLIIGMGKQIAKTPDISPRLI